MIRTSLARSLALQRRWDEGRAQFAAIEQLRPDELRDFSYLAKKAIFETKAGQGDLADRYERESAALLPEPAPLWLVLHVESIRYGLTKATQNHYADLWKKELQKQSPQRDGRRHGIVLDRTPCPRCRLPWPRPRRPGTAQVPAAAPPALNYRLEDLENVCEFLGHFPKESGLTRKLVQRGLKAHPRIRPPPCGRGRRRAEATRRRSAIPDVRHHLQEALRLAEASTRPPGDAHGSHDQANALGPQRAAFPDRRLPLCPAWRHALPTENRDRSRTSSEHSWDR